MFIINIMICHVNLEARSIEMEELMTVNEVASCLKIKPEIVRRKVRGRQLKAYKIGKVWRFSKESIKNYLNNCLS